MVSINDIKVTKSLGAAIQACHGRGENFAPVEQLRRRRRLLLAALVAAHNTSPALQLNRGALYCCVLDLSADTI
jgi:hypothetical protein